MNFSPTALPDVLLIEPHVFGDERGYFMETYQKQVFANAGIGCDFVQDNHSGSRQGILRGLHYQVQQAQGKLVRAVAGEVFDVAVDLRRSSPTFGQWVGEVLSAHNKKMLWIPPGFAHGFYVLSEWAEVTYKASDFYAPQHERSILWCDPQLKIHWPLLPGVETQVSPKDAAARLFAEAEVFA